MSVKFSNGSVDDPSSKEIFLCFFTPSQRKNRHICKCLTDIYNDTSKGYTNAVQHVKSCHKDWLSIMLEGMHVFLVFHSLFMYITNSYFVHHVLSRFAWNPKWYG
jgi:hypothetical protein